MSGFSKFPTAYFTVIFAGLTLLFTAAGAQAQSAGNEPIAFMGHGAMFDQSGRELAPTPAFIAGAQTWYRNYLVGKLTREQRAQFNSLQSRLTAGLKLDQQSQLVLNANLLDWLIKTANTPDSARIQGKNNLMRFYASKSQPEKAAVRLSSNLAEFKINPELAQRLHAEGLTGGKSPIVFLTTMNGGAAYRAECAANGVPVPTNVGGAGWVDRGNIPQSELFIGSSGKAKVLTYTSTSPAGMCVALPRYDPMTNIVGADGVICLGTATSKACFWDNEKNTVINAFPLGAVVPLSDFGGGTELIGPFDQGGGGVCSDCHAGENPYVIHGAVLNSLGVPSHSLSGSPLSLPTFAANWHDPIVRTGDTVVWPENPGPMNASVTPGGCKGCHTQGFAGRFPHLSPDIASYCNTVLRLSVEGQASPAIPATMPPAPQTPGSMKNDPEVVAFRLWCGAPSNGSTSDRGDPHIITFNGVPYDFQSAGEFISMRDDGGAEIQTRQTPMGTTTTPLANAHTGLTSCVSLNTAFAARVGTHRVTYEPNVSGVPDPTGLQLRIDGALTTLPPQGLNLSGGGRIVKVAIGTGIEIFFPNKTDVIVTSNWWPSQSKWYLNVDVVKTTAREGVMGFILPGNWLPYMPNGTSLGAYPANAHQRYVQLYHTFANAWRVTNGTSLFDYAPGTSTATFTNVNWPVENPTSCTIPGSKIPPAKPMDMRRAVEICSPITDKTLKAECTFDCGALRRA